MLNSIPGDQQRNYKLFRDYLAIALLEKISEPEAKPRRRTKAKSKKRATVPSPSHKNPISNDEHNEANGQDPGLEDQSMGLRREDDTAENTVPNDDLADFTDYIAAKTFACPPQELKTTDYYDYIASGALPAQYALPLTGADISMHLPNLDPGIADSLSAYGIINEETQGTEEFLAPVLSISHESLHSPATTEHTPRADVCEICGRDWIRLSYHHLIPCSAHAKAICRGWHSACDLQNAAWLCRACHRFVHCFTDHKDLARRFYMVELLLAVDKAKEWADWVARLGIH